MANLIGVYKITSPSNKIYIGSTRNYTRRRKDYKCMHCKTQTRLYNSLQKYTFGNHFMELIEECNIDDLFNRERYWQEYYNSIGKNGLNCIYVQTINEKRVMSEETKLKMSISTSGKNNPMYGKKISDDTKLKISIANKGRKRSFDLNTIQSNMMIGNTISKLNRKVIDTNTHIIYNSIRKASIALKINYSTLKKYLSEELKNKSTLKYF